MKIRITIKPRQRAASLMQSADSLIKGKLKTECAIY